MSTDNDKRILELKKQIEIKKEKLGKTSKFISITNCNLELDGARYNVLSFTKEQVVSFLVRLNAYKISAKDLGLLDVYKIGTYSLDDWITDLKARLDILSKKEEEKLLKAMEEKLQQLLSDGKKVELEIDEIANLLGN